MVKINIITIMLKKFAIIKKMLALDVFVKAI